MTTQTTSFKGIWPALLTPLTEALDIDKNRFAAHATSLLAAGCQGVTPFGTTGEGPSFSMSERIEAVDALVAGGVPADRILVSTSCAALPETLALTRHALDIGAHGCLMLPPYFLKGVSDQGVIDSYRWVIDKVADARLRLYLYNIPQVSGVALSHSVIGQLKELYPQTIVGIKDSACQRDASVALAHAFIDRVMVYVGNEPDLQTLSALGSAGAVSGLANMGPRLVQRLVTPTASPDAVLDQDRVLALLKILGGYALIPALKGVMAALSGDDAWLRVRPPLVAMDQLACEALAAQVRAFGIDSRAD